MLLYLITSVFFITSLIVILSLFKKFSIDNLQGLTFNYLTAALLSFLFGLEKNMEQLSFIHTFYPVALIIGSLFITSFFVTALTTQKSGVAVASVASKLSMVIPVCAGIFLYNETFNTQKIMGVIIALIAVIIVNSEEKEKISLNAKHLLFPLLTFIGTGCVDTSIKMSEHFYMNEDNKQIIISSLSGSAGLIGFTVMLFSFFKWKKKINFKNIVAGIILGACNYFSLFFIIKCLERGESSLIFALVNVGVVVLSVFVAQIFFREEINRTKMTGVMLALVAIAVLYFS